MATATQQTGTVLVLGATGKTGSRVAQRLEDQGVKVRLGSRRADPAFDWEDRSTWAPALDGVWAVYVAYKPDLAVPDAIETVADFFSIAQAAGVSRLVLLSGRGEPEAQAVEDLLMQTRTEWTIIRASWFFQNFSENVFLDHLINGEVVLPEGLSAEPFVDVEDIAEIAAQALSGPHHVARLYEVTGPRAIDFAEAVSQIGQATGRRIAFSAIPLASYEAALADMVPAEVGQLLMYLFTTVLDGRNLMPAMGVQQALGRPPATFEAYLARTAATGVWQARAGEEQGALVA